MVLICLGVALVVFTIMEMTPGEPAVMMLGDNATAESIAQFNRDYGLDRPFLIRFFNYVKQIFLHFDFGNSWLTRRPILDTLKERLPVTLIIAFSSIAFASLVGVMIGVLSVVKQYSPLDYVARVTAMIMAAVPVFWLGMMLTIVFALKLHWLPASGVGHWQNYVLPINESELKAVNSAADLYSSFYCGDGRRRNTGLKKSCFHDLFERGNGPFCRCCSDRCRAYPA